MDTPAPIPPITAIPPWDDLVPPPVTPDRRAVMQLVVREEGVSTDE